MAKVDLRKLKDAATEAFSKQKWGKAVELYQQITKVEPNDPDWFQREGECWRKLGDAAMATTAFGRAAEGYAKNGFLLKAIAVCKNILQMDPKHTLTQAMLAELYAKRDGGAPVATPPPPPAPVAPPPKAVTPPPPPKVDPLLGRMEAVELTERRAETPPARPPSASAPPRSAAIESLRLHEVLGGRQSQQFSAVSIDPASGDVVLPVAAYEIELGDDAMEEVEIDVPAPPPVRRTIEISPPEGGSELDFSEVLAEEASVEEPAVEVALDDELDFSEVKPDEAPPPRMERRVLPRIPLFSSLSPERLQQLIESVELREVEPGTVLVREGEVGASLYVIASGKARVEIAASAEPLAELEEGAFFGELGLLTDFPRSASVVATTTLQVLEVSREVVGRLIAEEPEVLRVLVRFFRDRMIDRWLKTSPLFATMSPDDARQLAGRWKFIELLPGVQAVSAGRRAEGMFLLLCGQARVVANGRLIASLAPGQIFGEMSLLSHQPATASVETETKCWALCLERAIFQEIMVTYPQVLQYVSDLAESRRSETIRLT